jgi:hypothetical protein
MTNEEMLADLKQFIATTVRQEVSGVEERLNAKVDGVEERLSTKIDDFQAAIGDALATESERVDARFDAHEQRLLRLERRTA